jgi:hypothetical protein
MAKGAKPKAGQSNSMVAKAGNGKAAASMPKPSKSSAGISSKGQKR